MSHSIVSTAIFICLITGAIEPTIGRAQSTAKPQGRGTATKSPPRPTPSTPSRPQPVAAPAYDFGDFDPNATKLTPNYLGHSIESTYSRFSPSPKLEFETAAGYKDRLPKANPDELLVFRIEPSGEVVVKYDPDAGVFDIRILEEFGIFDGATKTYARRAIATKKITSTTRYPAGNAFGASVMVTEEQISSFAVTFEGRTPGPGQERLRRISLPMNVGDAAQIKDRLAVLLLCRAYEGEGSLASEGREYHEPTISNPYATNHTHHYVRMQKIDALWVYDVATGVVFSKTPF